MNDDFVVTYGSEPKIWRRSCGHGTSLEPGRDGTLRPGDVEHAQRRHRCRSPRSSWDVGQEGRAPAVAGEGGER